MTTEFSELRAHWAHLKDLLRRKGSREEGRKEGRREEKTERGRKERRQVRNLHTDSIFTGFTFPPSSVKRYNRNCNIPFSSVQLISYVQLFATPWISARQASLSIINSQSLLKLMSIELVMPSNYLILCHHLLLLPSIYPSIRGFSKESVLFIRWPKYWSFSFNISPFNEYSRLISFRKDWLDLLAVQGTLKSLLQHHSSKASFFGAQLSLYSYSHIHTWLLEKP